MKFRSERERLMVLVGGVCVALLLYLGVLVLPAMDHIRSYSRQVGLRRADLERARALASDLLALKLRQPAAPLQSAQVVLDRVTRSLGISDHVASIEPFGANNQGANTELDDLDGPTLIRLLFALREAGIRPSGMELRDFKERGLWTVKLTIGG